MQIIPQWILWKHEDVGAAKPTKVPYSIKGTLASVTDPKTWSTFEECVSNISDYSGIGFVFTANDPYSFIDLDDCSTLQDGSVNPNHETDLNRQITIYREFDSYSEKSPSGKGLHIIVKGSLKSGRRRSFIEIYSTGRYATFTGNVFNDKPIAERQAYLDQLWAQMGDGRVATNLYKGDDREKLSDKEIIEQARTASNGDKFVTLLEGKWSNLYPSQSEADFAFIDIVAFYTQNRNQIIRLFQNSNLGQRLKAKRRDYLEYMINKSFDRMLPPIDFDGFYNIAEKLKEKPTHNNIVVLPPNTLLDDESVTSHSHHTFDGSRTPIDIPPGLLGDIAQFIYSAAPRPVPEIALAASIGLMAGICGRAYNVSNTGLNQFVLMLAPTGSGKEAMASGIDKLMEKIRFQVPTSTNYIGPSEISSGIALVKHLAKSSPCFVSILGEFGLRLQQISRDTASNAEIGFRRTLLDLFNKSGHDQVVRPAIYSDAEKNTLSVQAPAVTILGESTPERFYNSLTEDMIAEGLLPRFMIIEYTGPRPELNEGHFNAIPSFDLINRFATLVGNCESVMHNKKVIHVQSDPESDAIFKSFDKYCDDRINSAGKNEVTRQLWNRAHIKALKLAALIAVGINPYTPVIVAGHVHWAINMVKHDIRSLAHKFEIGEIGIVSDNKQVNETVRIMKEYLTLDWDKVKPYVAEKDKVLYDNKIIPYLYINKRLVSTATFRLDRAGATNAIKRSLQLLLDGDMIREVSKSDMSQRFGTTQKAFVLNQIS